MKRRYRLCQILCVFLAAGALGPVHADDSTKQAPSDAAQSSFAVIELFTSEGCSSCPPADQVFSDLVREARARGTLVYPIAFHVDYWNNLGWRDRFSSAAFSDRQRAYAGRFGSDSIYTPQAVVNGRVEFVGSDRQRVDREIRDALQTPATVTIKLSVKALDAQNQATVDYVVTGVFAKTTLNVAAVERDLQTQVVRGENAGRILRHENVVRVFRSMPLEKPQGQIQLAIPPDAVAKNMSIIAFVQDEKMTTQGAAGADMPLR